MCPAPSASVGFTWHAVQSYATFVVLEVTCAVCAPTRSGSVSWPHVPEGGAPVVFAMPPWHMRQLVRQVAPWQVAQLVVAEPPTPSRFTPWQPWQPASPAFAEYAWKPALAVSIQPPGWPPEAWMMPSRCLPPADGAMTLPARVHRVGVTRGAAREVRRRGRVRARRRQAVAGAAVGLALPHPRPHGRGPRPAGHRPAVAVDAGAGRRRPIPGRRRVARGGDPAERQLRGPAVQVAAGERVGGLHVADAAVVGRSDGAAGGVLGVGADADGVAGVAPGGHGRRAGLAVRAAVAHDAVHLPARDAGGQAHVVALGAGRRRGAAGEVRAVAVLAGAEAGVRAERVELGARLDPSRRRRARRA